MLWLRPYKPCDADAIVSWIRNETVFRWWGGHRFGEYPIEARSVNDKYLAHNGDCAAPDNFYPFTAFDETGPVGHFILRYLDGDRQTVRVGWVLLDSARRGQGLGREMLSLALRCVFDFLGADRVTLGVFADNLRAQRCYAAVGFRDDPLCPERTMEAYGKTWTLKEMAITRAEYEAQNRRT